MEFSLKNIGIGLLIILLVGGIFFSPVLSGKKLVSSDTVSNMELLEETKNYYENGDAVYWSTRAFSGMPTYTTMANTNHNFISKLNSIVFHFSHTLGGLWYVMLISFIGLLLMSIPFQYSVPLSILLGLMTWNISSLMAGHVTKIMCVGTIFLISSSLIAFLKYKNIWGILAFGLGLNLSICTHHIQVTYYGMIIGVVVYLYFLYEAVKSNSILSFGKKSLLLALMTILVLGSNYSTLDNLKDYSKYTMRGGVTELTPKVNERQSTSKDGGLDINYAFSWSYNFTELLNFIVPNSKGGTSSYRMDSDKSIFAKGINYAEDEIILPLYWGDQPFTSSPNYVGVILVFLFVVFLFYARSKFKWVLAFLALLSIMMGLGRFFLEFNEMLFKYLPFYNKFRTPTMSFSIFNVVSVIGVAILIRKLILHEIDKERLFKSLKYSGIIMIGIIGVLTIMNSELGYSSPGDAQILAQNPNYPVNLLKQEREALFKTDLFRCIGLLILAVFCLWLIVKDKMKKEIVMMVLIIVSVLDMWSVSKRYYANSDFAEVPDYESMIQDDTYSAFILQDQSYYRVFNTTVSAFNNNHESYRHRSVGGYSPAKLYRYQDLIDRHLQKGNQAVYDMLNTKYFIVNNNSQKMPQQNPNACGPAWFVQDVKIVENADAEMDSMNNFNPKTTAFVDKRFKGKTKFDGNTDPEASIMITQVHPDHMKYTTKSNSGGFAVFSEIWYKGNVDWKAYINGKEAPMVRTNYLLRGLYIPAGEHKVEFKFVPQRLFKMMKLSLVSTILFVITCLFIGWILYKNKGSMPFLESKRSEKIEA